MGTCNCCCRIPIILLSFLFIFSCSFSVISNAADTISHGQSITDGQTIISNGGEFALGFFSPANSTNRYVGIWYNKISVQTVVWIANRDNPIMDSSGVFTLGSNGNLMVLDGNGTSIWSSNSSVISNDSCAILMDSGNFILSIKEYVGRTDKATWQTFDYPTDTYLPGMRVGLNLLDGKSHIFTSWKTDNDPSKGNFTMAADPDGSAQIVMWEGSKRRWRSGLWNGQLFIGVPNMSVLYLYGFKISDDERGQMFFTYTPVNSSVILRFRIRWDGREEQVFWDERRKEWIHYWSQPINDCELYNQCGPFGSCNMLSTPICSCLYGFVPKSINEWNSGNWSSGCVRRTELQCERNITSANEVDGDGFREVEGVKLPDFATWRRTISSTNECADVCLSNCSCKAYAFVSGIGCLTWAQDVVDIQHFGEGGNQLYIRLPSSELGKKRKIPIFVIVIAVIIGTIVLSTSAYLIWRYKAKQRDLARKRKGQLMLDLSKSREFWTDLSGTDDIGEGNQGNGPELPLFSFNDIATATNNFCNTNKLGQGGFGPVFKGILPCGMEVAVKRLSRRSGQGSEEFKTEFVLIAKLQHRNLVRLLGCCVQGEERMLVYEYLPNKSLDAFIFNSTKKLELDWGKRFNIIEGIARGLLYLHRDSRLRIIHRDLKASNILLDKEMNPKISDFGMAKIFGGNQNQANTNRVVGTYGYMSPEYAMEGLFSVKSDVYSFGVLLLEIVSGKRNTQRHSEQTSNLLVHAWKLWNEGKAMEFFDSSISDSCSKSDVLRCIHVGLLCVQDNAVDRPTMSSVVLMLGSETASIPTPREPTFTIARTPVEMESSLESSEVITNNNVTVTMIVGR